MYAWFGGQTVPSGKAMERLAHGLNRPVVELWTTFEGGEVEPATLEAAVAKLVEVQARQTEAISLLVARLDVLASQGLSEQMRRAAGEVRQFALEASESGSLPRRTPAEDEA